jgi:hypothetical protein
MPSVDRVGRQFPLTFAASFEPHAHTLGRWWNGLLRIAAQVNAQPAWDLETLEAALQALPRGAEGEAPRRFVQELQSATDGSSLWWPPGDDVDADGSVTVVDGLPRGRQFVRLIRPGLQFRPWSG